MTAATQGRRLGGRLLALTLVLVFGVPAAAAGLSFAMPPALSPVAAAVYSGNAEAINRLATLQVASSPNPTRAQKRKAIEILADSFDATLLNPVAFRVRGLAGGRTMEDPSAYKWMKAAISVSRRDSGAYGWLAVYSARRNEIPQTLFYLDYALRSSFTTTDALLPVLVDACRIRASRGA
jgi:hypothetical protein